MQNDDTDKLREHIMALDAKFNVERMPDLKERLRLALHNLDDFEKTGRVAALKVAIDAYNEIRALGGRPPEELEECRARQAGPNPPSHGHDCTSRTRIRSRGPAVRPMLHKRV